MTAAEFRAHHGKPPPKTPANRPPRHERPPARPTAPAAAPEAREAGETSPPARPRFYPSTTRTPEGLLSARLVGYTQEQLQELFDFTTRQHGAKLYTS